MGASNYYSRTPEAFLEDYSRLLIWCGKHHYNGVVVWGLLRDCHGGVEAAKKLCDVANEAGVRLLCGVGLNAYGGVYYEGDSPYSLEQHLIKQPDLYATALDGQKMVFDFAGVKFFSSQVLGLLLEARARLSDRDGDVAVTSLSPQLERVFQITNLDSLFHLYADRDAALR